jgi:hypothetical protein
VSRHARQKAGWLVPANLVALLIDLGDAVEKSVDLPDRHDGHLLCISANSGSQGREASGGKRSSRNRPGEGALAFRLGFE